MTRTEFQPHQYTIKFLIVLEDFRCVMRKHQGREHKTTNREYTVELSYYFPTPSEDLGEANAEVEVVLEVSHDKNGVFTKHNFRGNGAKPFQFKTLKEDTDQVGECHSSKLANQLSRPNSRPETVNVYSEILQVLELLSCTGVERQKNVQYGVKFSGQYEGERFQFVLYTDKTGRLSTKSRKRKGHAKTQRKNIVWESEPGCRNLSKVLDEMVNWVKDAEGGRLSNAQIMEGPSSRYSRYLEDLDVQMSKLKMEPGQ